MEYIGLVKLHFSWILCMGWISEDMLCAGTLAFSVIRYMMVKKVLSTSCRLYVLPRLPAVAYRKFMCRNAVQGLLMSGSAALFSPRRPQPRRKLWLTRAHQLRSVTAERFCGAELGAEASRMVGGCPTWVYCEG